MTRAWSGLLAVLLLGACSDEDGAIEGEPVSILGAEARTFARPIGDGQRAQVGFTMPRAALERARTATEPVSVVLEFPEQVKTKTGFDHVLLDWNPMGHPPMGVYDLPHFDTHFYLIDTATREAIGCPETAVAGDRLPSGYAIPGLDSTTGTCVPAMGVHAVDTAAPEFTGGTFARSMLLIYHAGELVAVEPMLTLDALSGGSFTLPIPSPASLPEGVTLPAEFTVLAEDGEDLSFHLEDVTLK